MMSKARAAKISAAERRYQRSQVGCTITSIRTPRYSVRDNATGATHEVESLPGQRTCTCGQTACPHLAEVAKLERRLNAPATPVPAGLPAHTLDASEFSMFKR